MQFFSFQRQNQCENFGDLHLSLFRNYTRAANSSLNRVQDGSHVGSHLLWRNTDWCGWALNSRQKIASQGVHHQAGCVMRSTFSRRREISARAIKLIFVHMSQAVSPLALILKCKYGLGGSTLTLKQCCPEGKLKRSLIIGLCKSSNLVTRFLSAFPKWEAHQDRHPGLCQHISVLPLSITLGLIEPHLLMPHQDKAKQPELKYQQCSSSTFQMCGTNGSMK